VYGNIVFMMSNYTVRKENRSQRGVFLSVATIVFFTSLSAADSIGFVPYYIDGSTPATVSSSDPISTHIDTVELSSLPELGTDVLQTQNAAAQTINTTLPTRIEIGAVGIVLPVLNPSTRDIGALDTLLQKGPARYVDSAKIGENGNVIIFAHSSHLPVVRNQMFRAFNKVPELKAGDSITLIGADGVRYLYRVRSVVKADIDSGTTIATTSDAPILTLVTCDTLTGKSARFVLTADFVRVE
jgi:LPXTG-site transpeptidase (sortase) family protein